MLLSRHQNQLQDAMPKAYWIAFYRDVKDADKLAAYAKLAAPAISAAAFWRVASPRKCTNTA
jgi:hypothetical protein